MKNEVCIFKFKELDFVKEKSYSYSSYKRVSKNKTLFQFSKSLTHSAHKSRSKDIIVFVL